MKIELDEYEINLILVALLFFVERTNIQSKEMEEIIRKLNMKKDLMDDIGSD